MSEAGRASTGVCLGRLIAAVAVLAVLGYAYAEQAGTGSANPFDFFGYFTNLTSLLTCVVGVVAGTRGFLGRASPAWLVSARAVSTACMLVVAAVYNVLVPGTGSAPAWVSVTLHAVFPAAVLLDWVLAGDRARLPWRRLWIVLPYPLAWLLVVLVRGVTDGWVPYGFLLPERGVPSLLAHVAGLLGTLLAAGALVWGAARLPGRDRGL